MPRPKLSPINELSATLPSLSVNEKLARSLVSGFVSLFDPRLDELNDIKTSVSEAVTNCIVHAYRDSLGPIELTIRAYGSGVIYIKIKDKGCGIADIRQAMEPMYTSLPGEERSGLGFSVMESLCDSVEVKSRPGAGTTVVLRKRIKSRMEYAH